MSAQTRRVLLIGGTSEIGLAIVRRLAAEGTVEVHLLGRDGARLDQASALLARSSCRVIGAAVFDAVQVDRHEELIRTAFQVGGGFDLVILAIGLLGAQDGLDADPPEAVGVMNVNFTASGSLVLSSLRALRAQKRGTVIVLSSVAAERPRAGNAVYGAAKAGLDALAQGLGDAVRQDGVRVLVVRPGFVMTRMTAGLEPAPFATTPEAVAEAAVRGMHGRAHTVWVPAVLRFVFALLRHVPRPLYRRLPL